MKSLKPIYAIACLFLLYSGHAAAWPAAVNFTSDLGNGDGHAVTKTGGPNILRCDSASTYWEQGGNEAGITPESCHRHGLIWAAVSETSAIIVTSDNQEAYNPSVAGGGWRLPTIKELVRLFTYGTYVDAGDGDAVKNYGITDPVISAWLSGVTEGYLISSSYRNLDGAVNTSNTKNDIYAVHISSGRVVAVYPGPSGNIRLCLGLKGSVGDCQDFTGGKNDAAIDYATKDFYALKVRMQTVSELGYE
jgi:hypothetical protein